MRLHPGPIWLAPIMCLVLFPSLALSAKIQAGPWLQAVAETSVVIMWETDTRSNGAVRFGETKAYGHTRKSKAKRIAATSVAGDRQAVLHEVKLTGLHPGTRYQYQVQTGNAKSRNHTFTTHREHGRWRFTHTVSPNALVTSKANRTWASMSAAKPDFIVISGDISNRSANSDFHKFFTRAYPLAAHTPVYTVQGNHDDRKWSVYDAWVHNETEDRASERFYAFDIGPAHFVGINDNTPRADRFPVSWFERTLAQSRARWNIVFMNGNYRKYRFVQELLEDNKSNIDVILTSGSGNQYIDGDGILHVESGGAHQVYHVIEMTEQSFRATLYQSDGRQKGSKSIGVPTRPEPEPNTPPAVHEDGTEVYMQPVADSYTYELQANKTFGKRSIMQVRSARHDRVAYLKFDLRQAPGDWVLRAELVIYASYVTGGATVPVTVVSVDDQWTEGKLTWNRAPELGDTLARADVRQRGEYVFDVTPFVNRELAGDQVVSLALLDTQERDKLVNFWSREAARNQPALILTYVTDAPPPVDHAPPVAEIAAFPDTGEAPLTVTFDGAASSDADGQRLAYDWDFGDGTTASGAVMQHTYEDEGTYTAQLTVTDETGASSMADTLIMVRAPSNGHDEYVANGGFEDLDGRDRPYDWRLGSTGAWEVVDTEMAVGNYSLQLRGAHIARRTPIALAMTVLLEPGVYTLSARIATDGLGTQDGKRRGVRVSLKDESIQRGSGNIASTALVRGTKGWHRKSKRVVIDREGDYTVRIEAVNKPRGWAWIDAVSLIKE